MGAGAREQASSSQGPHLAEALEFELDGAVEEILSQLCEVPLVKNVSQWYGNSLGQGIVEPAFAWSAANDEQHASMFSTFLDRLKEIADFIDERSRPTLCKKVTELLDAMQVARVHDLEECNEYIEFLADSEPLQKALARSHPAAFADTNRQVELEQEPLAIQPAFTNDQDYIQMCADLKTMQGIRRKFV